MFIKAIEKLFANELANTKRLFGVFDPFSGHRPDNQIPGKSYFDSGEGEWVRPTSAKIIKSKESDGVIIHTVAFNGFNDEPGIGTYGPVENIGECGYAVSTVRTMSGNGDLNIKIIHGCKQLVGENGEWEPSEELVDTATVVLTKEKDGDGTAWCLASAYPGEPGVGPEQLANVNEGDYLCFSEEVSETRAKFWRNGEELIELDVSHVVIED